jgi:membrane protease subunit HflK
MNTENDRRGPPPSAMAEGGPWGSQDEDSTRRGGNDGPRNPWTPPSQGESGRPSDRGPSAFDELMRRARDSFGGGGGNGDQGAPGQPNIGRLALIAAGVGVAIWIGTTSVHFIGDKQRGVVSFLGSYSRTLPSGTNYTLPSPFESVELVDVGMIRSVELTSAAGDSERLVLTGDQNLLNLSYTVRWNVSNPKQFAFQVADRDETIKQVAESAMRGVIANVKLTDAMGGGRNSIESQVQQRMQEILDGYGAGISIQGVAINKAEPPNAVINAFKEVSAAQQDAESYVNNAMGYARQRAAQSQGEAAAFDKVHEQYRLAPEVTRRRLYYEAMESVLTGVNKTIVETDGVTPYLPLPQVGAGAAALPKPAVESASSATTAGGAR